MIQKVKHKPGAKGISNGLSIKHQSKQYNTQKYGQPLILGQCKHHTINDTINDTIPNSIKHCSKVVK